MDLDKNQIDISDNELWDIFFQKLNRQWLVGDTVIKIVHFGGSHIQADVWSNRVRQHFQRVSPYNHAGRGILFPFRVIKSNGSPYVKTKHSGKWTGFRNSVTSHESSFGVSGATAKLNDSIAKLDIWVNKNHCTNCYIEKLHLLYEDSLDNFCVEFNNDTLSSITSSNTLGVQTFCLSRPMDSISFSIKRMDSTPSLFNLYGLILESNNSGIQYHSVGVNGASVPSYLRCNYFQDHLNLISPDLVILSIGINDAYEPTFTKEEFMANYDSLIGIIKEVNPNVAILLTTNNDSYYKRKEPNERALIVRESMYELAKKHQAAVWDMFEIMGGLNSIALWEKHGLAKKDKIHLTVVGYKLIGDLMFEAMIKAYQTFIEENG